MRYHGQERWAFRDSPATTSRAMMQDHAIDRLQMIWPCTVTPFE